MGPLFIGCQWQRLTQQRGEVGSLAKRLNCYHPSSLSPHSLKYTNPNININTSMWIRVFDNIGLNISYEAFCLSLCLFIFHFKSVPLFWTRHFHIYFVFLSCLVLSISCLFLPVPAASYKSISSDTAPAPVDKGKVLRKKNHRKQCILGITWRGLRNWSGFGSYLGNFLHCQLLKEGISWHTWASHFQHKIFQLMSDHK